MKKNLTLFGLITLIVMTIILSLVNRQEVVVHYLFGRLRLPLIVVMAGAVLIGMTIQYLLGFAKSYRLKQDIKHLREELTEQQNLPTDQDRITNS